MRKAHKIRRCYAYFVSEFEMDVGLILKAVTFASEKHRGQRRKDPEASPYINHPISVANVLWNEAGIRDLVAITAAVLHDTVEDTDTNIEELETEFGPEVAGVVAECTDDKSLPKEERKRAQVAHAAHLSLSAQRVKIADKICNLRDIAATPPESWSLQRKQQYFDWAAEVVGEIPGNHGKLSELFENVRKLRP